MQSATDAELVCQAAGCILQLLEHNLQTALQMATAGQVVRIGGVTAKWRLPQTFPASATLCSTPRGTRYFCSFLFLLTKRRKKKAHTHTQPFSGLPSSSFVFSFPFLFVASFPLRRQRHTNKTLTFTASISLISLFPSLSRPPGFPLSKHRFVWFFLCCLAGVHVCVRVCVYVCVEWACSKTKSPAQQAASSSESSEL